jgi:hypothetical protein
MEFVPASIDSVKSIDYPEVDQSYIRTHLPELSEILLCLSSSSRNGCMLRIVPGDKWIEKEGVSIPTARFLAERV